MRRDWSDAVNCWANKPCVVCARWPRELAHVLGREYDTRSGFGRVKVAYVHPHSVVPLCQKHHRLYDLHQFDLWPYVKDMPEVIEWAFDRIGEGRALVRIRTKAVIESIYAQEGQ
jgi:hypothetical protein